MEKLEELTLAQAIMIGLGLTVAYYFLFFNSGEELKANLERMRGDISAKQSIAADTRKSLEEGEQFKQELESMSAKYQQAVEFLPSDNNVADVLRKVTQQVRSAGASIVKIEPQEGVTKKDLYEEFYIDIELQGRFAEITLFLAYLSKIPRIINVQNFEIKNENEKTEVPILTFVGQIIGYRYTGSKEEKPTPEGGTQ